MSHARLYIADTLALAPIPEELRVQSADREHFVQDAFGIADARTLAARAHVRAVEGGERTFLIHCVSITNEAQNALLKLFEEPPRNVVFHLVVRHEDILLPTLRSRMQIIARGADVVDDAQADAFLGMSYAERLDEITVRTKKKDVAWIESVVGDMERYVDSHEISNRKAVLESLILVRTYMGVRGSSSKMLLEELALSLPARAV